MFAADVMTPDVVCAAPDTPLAELVQLLLDNDISAVPIVADGTIIGIVSEGDLMRRAETETELHPSRRHALVDSAAKLASEYVRSHGRRASDVMTQPVVSVSDTAPLAEIVQLMSTHRVKRLPVVRESHLVGIVSRRNLLQVLAERLNAASKPRDDRAIRDDLLKELSTQTWAVWPTLNIIVEQGVVHLWGTAPDEIHRRALVVSAEGIPGVQEVRNHLDLEPTIDPLDRPNWPTPVPP